MKLKDIYNLEKTNISFEIFPPDDSEKIKQLYDELKNLNKYSPDIISVTCGAGGKNSTHYREILRSLKQENKTEIMPHFTCVQNSKNYIDDNIEFLQSIGCKNILALRGDIPKDIEKKNFDFCYANELAKYLKDKSDFSIAVAGYPETHIESQSAQEDLKYLKKKVESGADVIFTQMFFDNDKFYKFKDSAEKTGINIPIIPGIMPILSLPQLTKMIGLARITIPTKLAETIEKHSNDKIYLREYGIEYASTQCENLLKNEVKGLHFFTLNKSYSSANILENIL